MHSAVLHACLRLKLANELCPTRATDDEDNCGTHRLLPSFASVALLCPGRPAAAASRSSPEPRLRGIGALRRISETGAGAGKVSEAADAGKCFVAGPTGVDYLPKPMEELQTCLGLLVGPCEEFDVFIPACVPAESEGKCVPTASMCVLFPA